MSLPTVEEVQTAILKALDASPDGKINDTRTLVVNGKELGENGQTLVKAALDSLQTKDVSAMSTGAVCQVLAEESLVIRQTPAVTPQLILSML